MKFFLTLLVVSTLCGSYAQAQAIRVGALLPLSGAQAPVGAVQRAALEASVQALRSAGVTLELTLLDAHLDSSGNAVVQAAALVGGGAHVLICCNTPEEATQLAPLAAAANVPLITFSAPLALSTAAAASGAYWVFPLAAGEVAPLERLLLEPTLHPVGLMAPVGRSGDRAEALLAPVYSAVARYPESPDLPLTPEALRVATQEPASVVLWDEGEGTVRAAEALAARGYRGDIIVRSDVWEGLGALKRARLTGAKSVVSPAVLGYTLADTHPSKGAVSSFRRALIALPGGLLGETALEAGAGAWDAALLIGRAAEQVLAYAPSEKVPTELPDTLRGALRDALVGLGPVTGAGGSYDFSEGGLGGLDPGSLVLAEWRGGRFRPLP